MEAAQKPFSHLMGYFAGQYLYLAQSWADVAHCPLPPVHLTGADDKHPLAKTLLHESRQDPSAQIVFAQVGSAPHLSAEATQTPLLQRINPIGQPVVGSLRQLAKSLAQEPSPHNVGADAGQGSLSFSQLVSDLHELSARHRTCLDFGLH